MTARTSPKADYTNAAQQRLLKVLFALFNDVVLGLAPSTIAKAVSASPSAITRDLNNLLEAGLAERDEQTGHWRLTPRLPQQALKALNNLDRVAKRIEETRDRYTRNSY